MLLSCLLVAGSLCGNAAIVDFTRWSVIEDPVDPNFTATSNATTATLSAIGGPISSGVDIGFASVNGDGVSDSTFGNYFDPLSDFEIAVDYDLRFNGAVGVLGLGFGIGEDVFGRNSAGIAFVTQNGAPVLTYGGAARINDVDVNPPLLIGSTPSLIGSLFVSYDASSGDITLGAGGVGDSAPSSTGTFDGLQNNWNDEGLLASFFIRSQPWAGGSADGIFTNSRVLSGSATAIPEPNVFFSVAALAIGGVLKRRRRRSSP
ncbi:MAG: hypothetical protein AAF802_06365 [Planctomycetota bacterium]